MAKQSLGVRTTVTGAAAACAEILAASEALRVAEIDIFCADATGGTFGIGFPAAIGVSPSTSTAFQLHDGSDQPTSATISTAWSGGTPPTVPAQFLYRVTVSAATGASASIVIPEGIVIPANKSLVVWNITAIGAVDLTAILTRKPQAQTLANY